jgi:hypothetical protein
VACQSQFRVEGGRASLSFQCTLCAGGFGAADYAAYRTTMAQALSLLEREVVLKPKAH